MLLLLFLLLPSGLAERLRGLGGEIDRSLGGEIGDASGGEIEGALDEQIRDALGGEIEDRAPGRARTRRPYEALQGLGLHTAAGEGRDERGFSLSGLARGERRASSAE